MRFGFLFFLIIFISIDLNAQKKSSKTKQKTKKGDHIVCGPYPIALEFPGGDSALIDFTRENFNYTKLSFDSGEIKPTRIIICFVVKRDGYAKFKEVNLSKNVSIINEVKNLIEKMPRWKPEIVNGKTVDCEFELPILISHY